VCSPIVVLLYIYIYIYANNDTNSRKARGSIRNSKLEWVNVLLFHIGVSSALALIAVGVSNLLSKDTTTSQSGSNLVKAGFGIIFLCWVVLAIWTLLSFRSSSSSSVANYDHPYYKNSFASGNKVSCSHPIHPFLYGIALTRRIFRQQLLYSVVLSVPLILLRGIYAAISLFSSQPSSFSSNEAANVCMSVVPQLLTAVIFVAAGIMTRNIKAELSASQRVVRIREREESAPESSQPYV
jgi:hypothetical protein